MNIYIYILFAILSIIFGLIIGCCLRLLDEGISIRMAPTVFVIIYWYSFGFVGFVNKNKDIFIETLANSEVEKGTENRKEIINKRISELEEAWSKKYLRYLRGLMIKNFIYNYDPLLKIILNTTKDISSRRDKYRYGNTIKHFSFADTAIKSKAFMNNMSHYCN